VCSVDRVIVCSGTIRKTKEQFRRGRILRPGPANSEHLTVVLGRGNTQSVHVLVLTAFVGPSPPGCEGLHGDDNPTNNDISNLRWGTRSDNLHDAVRNGKRSLGEEIKHSKLTDDAVRFIRTNLHLSDHGMSKRFGVSAAAVKQVRDGITWKHVA
jgi:HNH endonuclease